MALAASCLVAGIIFVTFLLIPPAPKQDLKNQTFREISKIRGQKKQEVIDREEAHQAGANEPKVESKEDDK